MPVIQSQTVNMGNSAVTEFVDTVGTTDTSYTFQDVNTRDYFKIENIGSQTLITTINGQSYTLQQGEIQEISASYTTFSVKSQSQTAAFRVRASYFVYDESDEIKFNIKKGNNVNSNLSADKPFLEIISKGGAAGLHLTNSDGFTGPYILGIGKDVEGKGIELPNKANGTMITGTQRATVTDSASYWMQVSQSSTAAPLVRLEQIVADSAPALQLLALGSPTATQTLFYVGDEAGEAGRVYSLGGRLRWKRDIEIQDKDGSNLSKLKIFSQEGVADNQRHNFMLDKLGAEWFNYSGSAGIWYPFSIKAGGGTLNISAGANSNAVGTATYTPLISLQNTKIGFFGATPVTKRTGTAVTIEAVHAALVSLGLISP